MSNMTEGLLQQPSHGSSATTASNGDDSASTVVKKKRNQPGNADPDAEVIALSPGTLMATNRYMCEVCHKGFQRDQNLQLHRRGHNLPWKLKQRAAGPVKRRVYICPETGCPHHDPSRALGDLTGIKKHFCRKHGEKKWKCDKCSKRYAVQSDWKAHVKICGTREYRCDCGTIFSRRDSFITHRAFCDALTEENYKVQQQGLSSMGGMLHSQSQDLFPHLAPNSNSATTTALNLHASNPQRSSFMNSPPVAFSSSSDPHADPLAPQSFQLNGSNAFSSAPKDHHAHIAIGSAFMSATALLQKAAEMGAMVSDNSISPVLLKGFAGYSTNKASKPCGPLQEPCQEPVTDESHVFMGNQSGYPEKISSQNQHALHAGLYGSHMVMQQGRGNEESVYMQGGFVGGAQGEPYGRSERTTVDFLSLGSVGHMGVGERTGDQERTSGLAYSDEQQNLHEMHGYHHPSDGPRPMWNF